MKQWNIYMYFFSSHTNKAHMHMHTHMQIANSLCLLWSNPGRTPLIFSMPWIMENRSSRLVQKRYFLFSLVALLNIYDPFCTFSLFCVLCTYIYFVHLSHLPADASLCHNTIHLECDLIPSSGVFTRWTERSVFWLKNTVAFHSAWHLVHVQVWLHHSYPPLPLEQRGFWGNSLDS